MVAVSSAPKGDRRDLDAYYTPDALAQALVVVLPLSVDHDRVLEPHVGGGAFARALRGRCRSIAGMDINHDAKGFLECDRRMTGDFLAAAPREYDWVIGNPPYKGFEDHVDRALQEAPDVAFLLRLAALESRKRVGCWSRWPLYRVWVLAERPSFTEDGRSDSAAYGWFWFRRGHRGEARVVPGWSWRQA